MDAKRNPNPEELIDLLGRCVDTIEGMAKDLVWGDRVMDSEDLVIEIRSKVDLP